MVDGVRNSAGVIDAVAFSADGSLLAFQEARGPTFRGNAHTTVVDMCRVRSPRDGRVIAVYDVFGVTGLSIAPDSQTFVYSAGGGKVRTALVRVPEKAQL